MLMPNEIDIFLTVALELRFSTRFVMKTFHDLLTYSYGDFQKRIHLQNDLGNKLEYLAS